jgi:hypothetical protein
MRSTQFGYDMSQQGDRRSVPLSPRVCSCVSVRFPQQRRLWVAGTFNHKKLITISSGFGEGHRSPLVWDDASGSASMISGTLAEQKPWLQHRFIVHSAESLCRMTASHATLRSPRDSAGADGGSAVMPSA